MTGQVALGNARWAVPKSARRISVEKVALAVAGMPTNPLRATVAELCHSTNKIPSKTTQFKQCVMKSTIRFLNNIGKIDRDRPRL
jgi:hypothetical protein